MTDEPQNIQWPGEVIDADLKDIGRPLSGLLQQLGMLGTPEEVKQAGSPTAALGGPSSGVAIIESGATALGKWWAAAIGTFGGVSAITAAVSGFWKGEAVAVRVSITAGLGVVIATCLIMIGLIIRADLQARGQGSAAQYKARGTVAQTFLAVAQSEIAAHIGAPITDITIRETIIAVLAGSELDLHVYWKRDPSTRSPVSGIRLSEDGGIEIKIPEDWIPAKEVVAFDAG